MVRQKACDYSLYLSGHELWQCKLQLVRLLSWYPDYFTFKEQDYE